MGASDLLQIFHEFSNEFFDLNFEILNFQLLLPSSLSAQTLTFIS